MGISAILFGGKILPVLILSELSPAPETPVRTLSSYSGLNCVSKSKKLVSALSTLFFQWLAHPRQQNDKSILMLKAAICGTSQEDTSLRPE